MGFWDEKPTTLEQLITVPYKGMAYQGRLSMDTPLGDPLDKIEAMGYSVSREWKLVGPYLQHRRLPGNVGSEYRDPRTGVEWEIFDYEV